MLTHSKALTVFVSLLLSLPLASRRAQAQVAPCAVDTIPRAELAAEMRVAALSHGEYDLTATTNWTRFQSTLYVQLARHALEREPLGGVLFIRPDYLFWDFLSLAGVADPADASPNLLWALHLDQGTLLEYRADGIVKLVRNGTHPSLAVNVRTSWPDGTDRFSFIDTVSVPKLKVTNRQEITYRLLVFGDMVMYDEVSGTSGRPLSGVLGALFKLVGAGRIEYYRSVLMDDGLQVVRAKAKKSFFSQDFDSYDLPGRSSGGRHATRPPRPCRHRGAARAGFGSWNITRSDAGEPWSGTGTQNGPRSSSTAEPLIVGDRKESPNLVVNQMKYLGSETSERGVVRVQHAFIVNVVVAIEPNAVDVDEGREVGIRLSLGAKTGSVVWMLTSGGTGRVGPTRRASWWPPRSRSSCPGCSTACRRSISRSLPRPGRHHVVAACVGDRLPEMFVHVGNELEQDGPLTDITVI